MTEFTDDELSAYLDGDLPAARTAELERAIDSPALQQRLAGIRALRAPLLADAAPDRDLWPGIAMRIGRASSRRNRWWHLTAALLLGMVSGAAILGLWPHSGAERPPGERFVLLLHEGPEMTMPSSANEADAMIAQYRDWAQAMARRSALEFGEKLHDGEGFVLRDDDEMPRTQREGIGGLFILRASDYAVARALARTCPHLAYGGSIELRRIHDR